MTIINVVAVLLEFSWNESIWFPTSVTIGINVYIYATVSVATSYAFDTCEIFMELNSITLYWIYTTVHIKMLWNFPMNSITAVTIKRTVHVFAWNSSIYCRPTSYKLILFSKSFYTIFFYPSTVGELCLYVFNNLSSIFDSFFYLSIDIACSVLKYSLFLYWTHALSTFLYRCLPVVQPNKY